MDSTQQEHNSECWKIHHACAKAYIQALHSAPIAWDGEKTDAQSRVLALLLDGKWHTTAEICASAVGGTSGMRRLRKLRQLARAGQVTDVSDIEKRPIEGSTQWEYRAVFGAIDIMDFCREDY